MSLIHCVNKIEIYCSVRNVIVMKKYEGTSRTEVRYLGSFRVVKLWAHACTCFVNNVNILLAGKC
jgi:hypothetical protein